MLRDFAFSLLVGRDSQASVLVSRSSICKASLRIMSVLWSCFDGTVATGWSGTTGPAFVWRRGVPYKVSEVPTLASSLADRAKIEVFVSLCASGLEPARDERYSSMMCMRVRSL